MEDNITLQQGLEKFHKKNSKYFSTRIKSKDGEEFMKCHDISHVVFGCNTTIYGEGVVKLWTTFGTNLSFWKVIKGYNDADAFQLFKMYSFSHLMKNIGRLILVIPKVIVRAKRMNKPWSFSDYRSYLDVPLSEIRSEFNINPI